MGYYRKMEIAGFKLYVVYFAAKFFWKFPPTFDVKTQLLEK